LHVILAIQVSDILLIVETLV